MAVFFILLLAILSADASRVPDLGVGISIKQPVKIEDSEDDNVDVGST